MKLLQELFQSRLNEETDGGNAIMQALQAQGVVGAHINIHQDFCDLEIRMFFEVEYGMNLDDLHDSEDVMSAREFTEVLANRVILRMNGVMVSNTSYNRLRLKTDAIKLMNWVQDTSEKPDRDVNGNPILIFKLDLDAHT